MERIDKIISSQTEYSRKDIKKILAIFYFRFILSSTFRCLTSVFGMGTGEPPSYFHQYIFPIYLLFPSSLKTR